ncbi:hypothetical protein KIN20_036671 [Parelaphostrongylus tenuis]|uniref:Uncharacterized protein n=1 Tax=Parelaphostrongylus tenuis TaxID=148309 RepID=A0AAD5WLU8_PARTN|nr:hypothetical protein KIN20_036671 [Parelaphostrongylus tenuis]
MSQTLEDFCLRWEKKRMQEVLAFAHLGSMIWVENKEAEDTVDNIEFTVSRAEVCEENEWETENEDTIDEMRGEGQVT